MTIETLQPPAITHSISDRIVMHMCLKQGNVF